MELKRDIKNVFPTNNYMMKKYTKIRVQKENLSVTREYSLYDTSFIE